MGIGKRKTSGMGVAFSVLKFASLATEQLRETAKGRQRKERDHDLQSIIRLR